LIKAEIAWGIRTGDILLSGAFAGRTPLLKAFLVKLLAQAGCILGDFSGLVLFSSYYTITVRLGYFYC
jgi:hypothetical protein